MSLKTAKLKKCLVQQLDCLTPNGNKKQVNVNFLFAPGTCTVKMSYAAKGAAGTNEDFSNSQTKGLVNYFLELTEKEEAKLIDMVSTANIEAIKNLMQKLYKKQENINCFAIVREKLTSGLWYATGEKFYIN